MDQALVSDQVDLYLWTSYTKTLEYKNGMRKAIPAHHRLVEIQERLGLRSIYQKFIGILSGTKSFKETLRIRHPSQWLLEWKEMHNLLFEHVLIDRGNWRRVDVRFGDSGDEDLYRIPNFQKVPLAVANLAEQVVGLISINSLSIIEKYSILAKIHYEFIRIHPFFDGNGRIARAITDQLSIYFGFPPAMGGYPRHNPKNRKAYHKAIRSCVDDPTCGLLAKWIENYIEKQIQNLA
jgi:Fic family protein